MGGVVTDDVERVLPAPGGHDFERSPVLERPREVADLAVLLHGERGAREPRADRRGGVGSGGAVGKFERGAVGERDLHGRDATRGAAASAPTWRFLRTGGADPPV